MVDKLVLALEGGGTRSQAALLDGAGNVLCTKDSIAVNANFVPLEQAQRVVQSLVAGVLAAYGASGKDVSHFATSAPGPKFGAETLGSLCPAASFHDYPEMRVVFARAGIYRPDGIALVAATGATVWGINRHTGRELIVGGWGSLLGDEGSAYAMGLQGLRAAVRAFDHRAPAATDLVSAVCQHFNLSLEHFRAELVELVYHKPLSRAEIAGMAPLVTHLAEQGDPMAKLITAKTAADLAGLVLSAAGQLFGADEPFDVVMAGGMVNAGALVLEPLQDRLAEAYSAMTFKIGSEAPATALGRLLLNDLEEENVN